MPNQIQNPNVKTKKVLVAISGGVDSAVAAALLIERGYEVTGGFIKCYSANDANRAGDITNQPCWLNEKRDATRVCAKLGIKLVTFDFEKEYRKSVVDYIYREYRAGRTPNPDVMCNKHVKFPLLIREAKKLGFDYIATGHYARLVTCTLKLVAHRSKSSKLQAPCFKLLTAVDDNKDQTYFLHQLTQKELKRVMFPIGDYTKPQVRELAKKFGLPVAQKEESMGICFIGEVPLRQFLSKKIKSRPGKIILADGTAVGEHSGLPFYTIGQRIGLSFRPSLPTGKRVEESFSIAKDSSTSPPAGGSARNDNDTKPFYVVAKNRRKNQIIVAHENSSLLYKKEIIVQKVNWIVGQPPKLPLRCLVRLRHRQPLQSAVLARLSAISSRLSAVRKNFPNGREQKAESGQLLVRLDKPQRAIAPGQFAVFYKGKECLGGGEIV